MGRRDADGWTVFTPPKDARIIYVSSSRGDDRNRGTSPSHPFKTLARGKSFIRNGKGDWLLLKRGDVWHESLGNWVASGKSQIEPALVGAYGDGPRPVLKTGASSGITVHGGGGAPPTKDHLAIIGIEFYAHTRDPSAPEFDKAATRAGGTGLSFLRPGDNLLIEDCAFRFYKVNLVVQAEGTGLFGFTLRRCVVVDAYSTDSHSQGIFMSNVHGALFDENVFDHNGWNEQVAGAEATIFNHNLYIQNNNAGVTVRGNIVARGASHGVQLRCGGTAEDNLFIENSIALFVANAAGAGAIVRENVILSAKDITDTLPRKWAFEANDSGGPMTPLIVERNIIANTPDGSCALALNTTAPGAVVTGNIIFNWGDSKPVGAGIASMIPTDNEFGRGAAEYIDPHRSPGTYNATRGGTATLDTYLDRARHQATRGKFAHTSRDVRDYVRAGFRRAVANTKTNEQPGAQLPQRSAESSASVR